MCSGSWSVCQGLRSIFLDVLVLTGTPQDILASDFKSEIEICEEDFIAFFNTGAYGFTASPVYFLSHSLPAEIII